MGINLKKHAQTLMKYLQKSSLSTAAPSSQNKYIGTRIFSEGGWREGRLYTAKISVIDDKTKITTTTTTNSKRDKSKYKHNL